MQELANIFYEMVTGTTPGHMGHVPNNPVLYSITTTFSSTHDSINSMSKEEFKQFLTDMAESL